MADGLTQKGCGCTRGSKLCTNVATTKVQSQNKQLAAVVVAFLLAITRMGQEIRLLLLLERKFRPKKSKPRVTDWSRQEQHDIITEKEEEHRRSYGQVIE